MHSSFNMLQMQCLRIRMLASIGVTTGRLVTIGQLAMRASQRERQRETAREHFYWKFFSCNKLFAIQIFNKHWVTQINKAESFFFLHNLINHQQVIAPHSAKYNHRHMCRKRGHSFLRAGAQEISAQVTSQRNPKSWQQ